MNLIIGLVIGFLLGVLATCLCQAGPIAEHTRGSYQPIRRPGDGKPSPPQGGSGAVRKRAKRTVKHGS